ncbi:aldose epimerase family protein [Streptacidiphilus fuscans]|uniref:Aldose 1-epimerase n=1 Tax=Streptacidiphilus fuscans TaxID=2789292 RepID=A0A931AYK9_9ACTN|nr:aldose epimerase family protein [Streptacidiphilus fuscans]MBF9066943.1 galactose mutarotase [Streptacidiphilus fuscans]
MPPPSASPSLAHSAFGATPDGTLVTRWTLDSGTGVRAQILDFGGILHRLEVPDTIGRTECVVLGLPELTDYTGENPFLGALVGRYANRIAHGRFLLDGAPQQVAVNDRGHALHGGPDGFHRRVWHAEPHPRDDAAALRLHLHSPDGDMGFPGALDVTAEYTLDQAGTLRLDFTARTSRATPVNLTHHAYFNLAGAGSGDVLAHLLTVDADRYLPVTAQAIPLGPTSPTAGTPFDFTTPHPIGARIGDTHRQLRDAGGYDHCWVLREPPSPGALRRAAHLADPDSGRRMEVWTAEPGVQIYTGNQLDGSLSGPSGKPYEQHAGVCLETQHFPDSPNQPSYPDTVLRPGEELRSTTEFRFPHLHSGG